MRADTTDRYVVTVHQLTEQLAYGTQLRLAGLLVFKVPQGHDPNIGEIVILDVSALIAGPTPFPHSTSPVHNEVVSNVPPASTSMRSAYRLDARCRRGLVGLEER